jgi:hypothetical protein
MLPCLFKEARISRSLTSSLGKALSKSFLPARSTGHAVVEAEAGAPGH